MVKIQIWLRRTVLINEFFIVDDIDRDLVNAKQVAYFVASRHDADGVF